MDAKHYRSKVLMPVGLPDLAYEGDWLKSLAFFTLLKGLYEKPVFYSYSLRRLQAKLKTKGVDVSTGFIRIHLGILESKGLVSIRDGNLCLAGLSKLAAVSATRINKEKTHYKRISIFTGANLKEQLDILRGRIIVKNLQQPEGIVRRKTAIVLLLKKVKSDRRLTKSEYVRFKKLRRSGQLKIGKVDSVTTLTITKISEMFGINRNSAQSLKQVLVDKGIINSELIKGSFIARQVSPKAFSQLKETSNDYSRSFLHKGNVYIKPICRITIALTGKASLYKSTGSK